MRVLAALSGGVDSAVAAARAKDAGHDVTAVHLALSPSSRDDGRGCCTPEDARDARRAADVLDLPFYVWDLAARFQAEVVDDFLAEYAAGRTPNPCLRCNERIKFSAVLDKALALGFDAVCTGHYARLVDGELRRAADRDKDQSYVLGVLTREQLRHSLFPVGVSTKAEVRAEAAERGLAVAGKRDSYDVCFVPGDTGAWLRERLGTASGPIVEDGEVVGAHEGAHAFTVGQRRGLGLPSPDGRPRYVLSISPATATVEVGPAERLDVTELDGVRPSWTGDPYAGRCLAQVRAHGDAVPATVTPSGDGVTVTFEQPVRGIAPGQAVVLYDGDRVLGAATISRAGGRSSRSPVRSA